MTSPSCTSPKPCTSPPASSSARTTSRCPCAPAGEPVVSRHSEQSGRQLGASVGPAHVPQPVLRQLFQILEGGAVGELGIRHTPFLPCLPGVRASGWKSGSLVIDER